MAWAWREMWEPGLARLCWVNVGGSLSPAGSWRSCPPLRSHPALSLWVGPTLISHLWEISPRPLPTPALRALSRNHASPSGPCSQGHHAPASGAPISPPPRKFPFWSNLGTSCRESLSPLPSPASPLCCWGPCQCSGRGQPGAGLSQGLELGTRRWVLLGPTLVGAGVPKPLPLFTHLCTPITPPPQGLTPRTLRPPPCTV